MTLSEIKSHWERVYATKATDAVSWGHLNIAREATPALDLATSVSMSYPKSYPWSRVRKATQRLFHEIESPGSRRTPGAFNHTLVRPATSYAQATASPVVSAAAGATISRWLRAQGRQGTRQGVAATLPHREPGHAWEDDGVPCRGPLDARKFEGRPQDPLRRRWRERRADGECDGNRSTGHEGSTRARGHHEPKVTRARSSFRRQRKPPGPHSAI